jgi:hypothetical protein
MSVVFGTVIYLGDRILHSMNIITFYILLFFSPRSEVKCVHKWLFLRQRWNDHFKELGSGGHS